jgi:hypothetical protein
MYFDLIPNIEYDEKPISYPFSESDFVVAKNFFRRYKLNDDIFSYAVYFSKYAIVDGERPDMVADKAYGDPYYDWVILLTNNMVNVQYDWPMTNYQISKVLETEYDNAYSDISYYETIEIAQYPAGMKVDKAFYDKQHKLNIDGSMVLKNGSEICNPISIAEHFYRENEKKREIYLLKPAFFQSFVDDFRKKNLYKKDANYISQRLKKTG